MNFTFIPHLQMDVEKTHQMKEVRFSLISQCAMIWEVFSNHMRISNNSKIRQNSMETPVGIFLSPYFFFDIG